MSDRIYYTRPKLYETLVREFGIFGSYVDMFMFCAALGYQRGQRQRDEDGDKEMLWANVNHTDLYTSIAASIAYQETGNPEILSDQLRQLEILGEYAAGGVDILEEAIDTGGDPTIEFAEFVLEEGAPLPKEGDDESSLSEVI
ncbi:hypothetical protein [Salinigranum halophilum]|uniref:hypothetical protein n=1 Tax=Salinigranum halophilum TaxID=2565931 RepID=UPI00115CBDD6|nr:hypothetical protein [Salinigranum halophilum]